MRLTLHLNHLYEKPNEISYPLKDKALCLLTLFLEFASRLLRPIRPRAKVSRVYGLPAQIKLRPFRCWTGGIQK